MNSLYNRLRYQQAVVAQGNGFNSASFSHCSLYSLNPLPPHKLTATSQEQKEAYCVYSLSCGELLKGEVFGSSNAKRINNLPVDMEAVPPTVRG